ncbi:TrkA family potassium uptake protein [Lactobacillus sp.]|uniref:potassium channel family protein n=1 Tax=Lactobacillus sp. TaxID=1591 RepID=UPI0019B9D008|nr:TrkA family potassium uptake protein [Lactobacillus sp.]MBD5429667.1 TrkA family potassium uptake protein [Lactobacillus sp.]
MAKKESYAVIGLGQFGSAICQALVEANQEVLAIDINEEVVEEYADMVMEAVIADAQDEEAMHELDIGSFDHVYVSIGRNIAASVMATMIVKEAGVPDIICRAENATHARVLEKVGATKVVRPEHDLAMQIVFHQLHPSVIDYVDLNKNLTLAEINVANPKIIGKTIDELDFRNRYNVNILAIINEDDDINQLPQATDVIHNNDKILVIGKQKDIHRLNELMN